MATYKCSKCGNTFEESEMKKSPDLKGKAPANKSESNEKCCPSCGEMGDFCKFDEEEVKSGRYD